MSQGTLRYTRCGVKKAVAAFFAVATLISFSSVAVRADDVTVLSMKPVTHACRSVRAVRFFSWVDPVFGFPMVLDNLTWGNYEATHNAGGGSYTTDNLTWGNFSSGETAPEPQPGEGQ